MHFLILVSVGWDFPSPLRPFLSKGTTRSLCVGEFPIPLQPLVQGKSSLTCGVCAIVKAKFCAFAL